MRLMAMLITAFRIALRCLIHCIQQKQNFQLLSFIKMFYFMSLAFTSQKKEEQNGVFAPCAMGIKITQENVYYLYMKKIKRIKQITTSKKCTNKNNYDRTEHFKHYFFT